MERRPEDREGYRPVSEREHGSGGVHRPGLPDAAPPKRFSGEGAGRERHDTPTEEIARIRPRSTADVDSRGASHRDDFDRIVPGPGHSQAVDNLVRERMEEESPDGRPPSLEDRRKSRTLFYIVLAVVWIVVISAVGYVGGWAMAGLVLLLTAIYIGYASWPVWRAAIGRQADERRAEREVANDTQGGMAPTARPPGPMR